MVRQAHHERGYEKLMKENCCPECGSFNIVVLHDGMWCDDCGYSEAFADYPLEKEKHVSQ